MFSHSSMYSLPSGSQMLHLNTILLFQFSVKYVTLPCCSSSDLLQSLYFACKHPACYLKWSHCGSVTGNLVPLCPGKGRRRQRSRSLNIDVRFTGFRAARIDLINTLEVLLFNILKGSCSLYSSDTSPSQPHSLLAVLLPLIRHMLHLKCPKHCFLPLDLL